MKYSLELLFSKFKLKYIDNNETLLFVINFGQTVSTANYIMCTSYDTHISLRQCCNPFPFRDSHTEHSVRVYRYTVYEYSYIDQKTYNEHLNPKAHIVHQTKTSRQQREQTLIDVIVWILLQPHMMLRFHSVCVTMVLRVWSADNGTVAWDSIKAIEPKKNMNALL
jgi:hypothetical protein